MEAPRERREHLPVRNSWCVKSRPHTHRVAALLLAGGLALAPAALADTSRPPVDDSPTKTQPEPAHPVEGTGAGGGGAVPGGVSVSGLTAGSGSVDIREYIDMSSASSGKAHQRVARALLSRVAAEGLGSVSLRPLITTTDVNSTEAGRAVVAAGLQNRAWEVTAALFRAQSAGGDWVNPTVLRRIGSGIGGLKVARFLRDSGPSAYPALNAIRGEAQAAGVTVTPAFVVRGPNGTKLVTQPGNAGQVIDAIKSVR